MKKILFLLSTLTTTFLFGQKSNEILSLRIGYNSANIVFKEAFEPSFQFFGYTFKSGKTFAGDGPEAGIAKSINSKLFIDLGISSFSGEDIKTRVNNNENYYTLRGFHMPLTANYLLRNSSKKLRINIGAGFQYLKAHLQQFEKITTGSGEVVNQLTDISISELGLAIRPGIQFRIIQDLVACFIVKVSISPNGRYTDSPAFSLKYTFTKKK
mgnify:CR=1 FL=1